jgi:uncharacterized membrane protein
MIRAFMKWCDKSLLNSVLGWLALLFGLYLVAYPIYYLFAALVILVFFVGGVFVLDLKLFKNVSFLNSLVGFVMAFVITLYVGLNYLRGIGLWELAIEAWGS